MSEKFGRRLLLRRAALLVGMSGVFAASAPRKVVGADPKMPKQEAEYQPTPKNGQTCAACELFTPPAACKIVRGSVSPQGWCQLFSRKTN
ncbi:MAG TPA: high-potential iron-sulfur protein [Stellaceae bacterium]|nr:high-potential iron-sulfur protein [Stellaceae bacterium]